MAVLRLPDQVGSLNSGPLVPEFLVDDPSISANATPTEIATFVENNLGASYDGMPFFCAQTQTFYVYRGASTPCDVVSTADELDAVETNLQNQIDNIGGGGGGGSPESQHATLRQIAVRARTTNELSSISAIPAAANVDGVSLVDGDLVLVMSQSDTKQNGIYVVNDSGAWTRHPDFNTYDKTTQAAILIREGSAMNANTKWRCDQNGEGDFSSSGVTFSPFFSSGPWYLGTQPVKDLAVVSKGEDSLQVEWTAPPISNLPISHYDIRYSTSQITESTFSDATVVTEPVSGSLVPGVTNSVSIFGLQPETTYYIAVKAITTFENLIYESDLDPQGGSTVNVTTDSSGLISAGARAIDIVPDQIIDVHDYTINVSRQNRFGSYKWHGDETAAFRMLQILPADIGSDGDPVGIPNNKFQMAFDVSKRQPYEIIVDLAGPHYFSHAWFYTRNPKDRAVKLQGKTNIGDSWEFISVIDAHQEWQGPVSFDGAEYEYLRFYFDDIIVGGSFEYEDPPDIEIYGSIFFGNYSGTNKPLFPPAKRNDGQGGTRNPTIESFLGTNLYPNENLDVSNQVSGITRVYTSWRHYTGDEESVRPNLNFNNYGVFSPHWWEPGGDNSPNGNPSNGVTAEKGPDHSNSRFRVFFENSHMWNTDSRLQEMNNLGMSPYFTHMLSPEWLSHNNGTVSKPNDIYVENKDIDTTSVATFENYFTNPEYYKYKARFAWHTAARYGSNSNISPPQDILDEIVHHRHTQEEINQGAGSLNNSTLNQTAKFGLDLLHGYECENEADGIWQANHHYMKPEELAAMTSACYDGHEGTLGSASGTQNYYGVKNADPNFRLILPGTANVRRGFLTRMLIWWAENRTDGVLPFDTVSFHHYATNGGGQAWNAQFGVSPEMDRAFNRSINEAIEYFQREFPEKELWLTEYGWSEHGYFIPSQVGAGAPGAGEQQFSVAGPMSAPTLPHGAHNVDSLSPELFKSYVKGGWTLRSIPHFMDMGVDHMAQYWIKDESNFYEREPFYHEWINGDQSLYREKADENLIWVKFTSHGYFGSRNTNGYYPIHHMFWYIKTMLNRIGGFTWHGWQDPIMSMNEEGDPANDLYVAQWKNSNAASWPSEPASALMVWYGTEEAKKETATITLPEGTSNVKIIDYALPDGMNHADLSGVDMPIMPNPRIVKDSVDGFASGPNDTTHPNFPLLAEPNGHPNAADQRLAIKNYITDDNIQASYNGRHGIETEITNPGSTIDVTVSEIPKIILCDGNVYKTTRSPNFLEIDDLTDTSAEVLWQDRAVDEDGFEVHISDSSDPQGSYTSNDIPNPNTQRYSLTGLTGGTTRYVKVRSYKNDGGQKRYSLFEGPVRIDVPNLIATPTLNSATGSLSGITVSWSSVSAAASYEVWKKASGGPWILSNVISNTQFLDETTIPGIEYTYRIKAIGPQEFSNFSNTIAATRPSELTQPPVVDRAYTNVRGDNLFLKFDLQMAHPSGITGIDVEEDGNSVGILRAIRHPSVKDMIVVETQNPITAGTALTLTYTTGNNTIQSDTVDEQGTTHNVEPTTFQPGNPLTVQNQVGVSDPVIRRFFINFNSETNPTDTSAEPVTWNNLGGFDPENGFTVRLKEEEGNQTSVTVNSPPLDSVNGIGWSGSNTGGETLNDNDFAVYPSAAFPSSVTDPFWYVSAFSEKAELTFENLDPSREYILYLFASNQYAIVGNELTTISDISSGSPASQMTLDFAPGQFDTININPNGSTAKIEVNLDGNITDPSDANGVPINFAILVEGGPDLPIEEFEVGGTDNEITTTSASMTFNVTDLNF